MRALKVVVLTLFLTVVLNAALLEFVISFSVILRLTCKKLILLLFKLYLTGIAPVSLYRVRMWLYLSNRKTNWMIFYLRAHRLHLYPTDTFQTLYTYYIHNYNKESCHHRTFLNLIKKYLGDLAKISIFVYRDCDMCV